MPPQPHKRIDQLLSSLGYCSRSEAIQWIAQGRVLHRNDLAKSASEKVDPTKIRVDGKSLEFPDGFLAMFHKPVGYVCSHAESEGKTIYQLLPERWMRRNPRPTSVGRLDRESSGLLLITDCMELVHEFTSPKRKVAKVYQVTVDQPLDESMVGIFASGTLKMEGEDHPCRPADLRLIGSCEAEVTLLEGRYHQVRRMFEALGRRVMILHRTQMGDYHLGNLKAGQYQIMDFPVKNGGLSRDPGRS